MSNKENNSPDSKNLHSDSLNKNKDSDKSFYPSIGEFQTTAQKILAAKKKNIALGEFDNISTKFKK